MERTNSTGEKAPTNVKRNIRLNKVDEVQDKSLLYDLQNFRAEDSPYDQQKRGLQKNRQTVHRLCEKSRKNQIFSLQHI